MSKWTLYDDREKNGRIEIAKFGRTVARLYYKDGEALSDARLIAAAPELLDALREVVRISDRKHNAWDAAKAAIAKAEGREP